METPDSPPPQPPTSPPSTALAAPAESAPVAPVSPFFAGRRRNGKVARLPKAVRDKINQMLQDGFTYPQILEATATEAPGLTDDNLGRWRSGGHQDWLREQQAVETLRLRQDHILELVASKQGSGLHLASLQIAATGITELLLDTNMRMLRGELEESADKLTRMLNATARLSDSGTRCEQHQHDQADREAKAAKEKNPEFPKVVTAETLRKAEKALRLL